jgi:hypothetical protein
MAADLFSADTEDGRFVKDPDARGEQTTTAGFRSASAGRWIGFGGGVRPVACSRRRTAVRPISGC